jgi:hypothetical protein
MRKLSVGFALSTLAFAGSTIYYRQQLAAERALHADIARPPTLAAPAPVPAITTSPLGPPPPDAGRTRDAPAAKPVTADAGIDARGRIAQHREFLAMLANPQSRAARVAKQKAILRSFTPGLQRHLALSDDAFDRFLEALVELELAGGEASARCALDENCRSPAWDRSTFEARQRDALSQFGPGIAEKYEFFQRTTNERRLVVEIRGRLPDDTRLTDAQAEQFVRAMSEENQRIQEDLARGAGNIGSFNGLIYAELQDGPADGTDRGAEAAEYNRGLRERAATVLNAAQLKVYEQMQDEAVQQQRAYNPPGRAPQPAPD